MMKTYQPLYHRLVSLDVSLVRMHFSDIEEIIGRDLPNSARTYPAWWANNDQEGKRHSTARLTAGWRTEDLSLEIEEVTFTRLNAKAPNKSFAESFDFSLAAVWHHSGNIALSEDKKLIFPAVPSEAGVYRFRFLDIGPNRSYIGESANIRSRFGFYRNPGPTQATNIRLNTMMVDHLSMHGRVELDVILDIGCLSRNGTPLPNSLSDKAIRRLMEQAAIISDQATEIASLNR